MDSRYTNREKFLDSLSDRDIAIMVRNLMGCDNCPAKGQCQPFRVYPGGCIEKIEKWLGEYSDG